MDQMKQRDLENRLRDAYRAFRERSDPTWVMGPSARQDKVWERAAVIVDRFKADPFEYVRFQFDSHHGSAPQYTQLASQWAIENYQRLSRSLRQAQGVAVFERQIETLLGFVSGGSEPDKVLWDEAKEFMAVVRVLMCSDKALEGFLNKYGDQARRELNFDKPLREHINKNYDRSKSIIREGVSDQNPGESPQVPTIQAPSVAGHLVPTGPRRAMPPSNPPGRTYLHE